MTQPADWEPFKDDPKFCIHHGPCRHEAKVTDDCKQAADDRARKAGQPIPLVVANVEKRRLLKQQRIDDLRAQGAEMKREESHARPTITRPWLTCGSSPGGGEGVLEEVSKLLVIG